MKDKLAKVIETAAANMTASQALDIIVKEIRQYHDTIADLTEALQDAKQALDLAQSCMDEGSDRQRVIDAHIDAKLVLLRLAKADG